MIETVYRGDELPAEDRFEGWREMVRASHAPVEVSSDHAWDFRATLRLLDLGSVQLAALDCPPVWTHRTPRLIRRSDPELYPLLLVVEGTATVSQAGRVETARAGELMLYSMSHPHRGWLAEGRRTSLVEVLTPRALLPLAPAAVDGLLAVRMSGERGVGGLLAQFLTRLVGDATAYSPADMTRLSAVTIDLVTALLAGRLDAPAPPEAHPYALVMRVRAFIMRHLGDPGLTPGAVAAAHHVSLRTLHRHFQPEGMTVAAFIRHCRLEHARRDLIDPGLSGRPIHAIAAVWGFAGHTEFTRAFRRAYGVTPGEYRASARERSGGTDRRGLGTRA